LESKVTDAMGEVAVGVFVAGLFYTIYKLMVGEAEPDRKGGTRDTGKKKTEEKTVTFYPPEGPPYEVPYEGEGGYGAEEHWEEQTKLEQSLQERATIAAGYEETRAFDWAASQTSAAAEMGYVPPPKPHDVWEEPTAHGTEILWVDVERSLGERTTQAAGLYGPPARSSSAGMVTTTASPWSRGVETARATAAAHEPR